MPVEAGVTVVLIVVVLVPDEVPADDDVGAGWGAGTVEGEGMLDPDCGEAVAGPELGGGTCESGG